MVRIRLRFVHEYRDRHGHIRRYFRRNGRKVALPGEPGSREFREAYEAALAESEKGQPAPRKARTPRSFDDLAARYFQSQRFARMAPETRRTYRGVIERLLPMIGHRQVAEMRAAHVDKLLARFQDRPGAGNEALKKLRVLIEFARRLEWIDRDPTHGAEKFKAGEFHSWTEEEIAAFETRHPIGSRARTAFALHLFTGQRRGDVVRMSWRDIEAGGIHVAQDKTAEKLWIPIHLDLQRALDAWPRENLVILVTGQGRPFSVAGYGNWFRDVCREAGLPEHCSSHGLRKAAGRRLAETGASAKEIAAILGHRTLQEVERYTRAADQKVLATAAIARIPVQKRDE